MSGKNLVQQMRDGALPPPKREGSGIGGLLFTAICTFVIGGSAVFGLLFYLQIPTVAVSALEPSANIPKFSDVAGAVVSARTDPGPGANMELNSAAWTAEDDAACLAAARQAEADEDAALDREQELMPTLLPVSSAGMAEQGALVMCYAATKLLRLCEEAPRRDFALLIERYAKKIDSIEKQFNGMIGMLNAPTMMVAGIENPAADFFEDGMNQSAERIMAVHKQVAMRLRELVSMGLVSREDFDVFFGYGVPATIELMMGDARVTNPICT